MQRNTCIFLLSRDKIRPIGQILFEYFFPRFALKASPSGVPSVERKFFRLAIAQGTEVTSLAWIVAVIGFILNLHEWSRWVIDFLNGAAHQLHESSL